MNFTTVDTETNTRYLATIDFAAQTYELRINGELFEARDATSGELDLDDETNEEVPISKDVDKELHVLRVQVRELVKWMVSNTAMTAADVRDIRDAAALAVSLKRER